MAGRVVEAIEAATNWAERRHDAGLVADLEIAMASALKGIDHARNPRRLTMGESGYVGPG